MVEGLLSRTRRVRMRRGSELRWHQYHIGAAIHAATKSKDPSTKVGCVLVGRHQQILSTGFNDFPRGVVDTLPERRERPVKYLYTEHAERNAVYNAARHGVALDGAIAYLNYAPCPCTDCARALIQVGVRMVVGPDIPFPGGGAGTHYDVDDRAVVMLREAGVPLLTIPYRGVEVEGD